MKKTLNFILLIVAGLIFPQETITAQEFPIATGSDTTSPGEVAFDGTNYLIGIQGDIVNSKSITAQFLSANGSLVGSRISLGRYGGSPLVAFDGSNYLMSWSNIVRDTIYGQFITKSGILTGAPFAIAHNINIGKQRERIAFGDTSYMIIYKNNDINYGQSISKSGNLIGTATQISFNQLNDNEMAFDGTNYLVAWAKKGVSVADQDIYGQFINQSGNLVGSNFMIDDGNYASDNPISIAFDGSRYLVAYHEQAAAGGGWNLFARFVTASGTVAANRITIRDSSFSPGIAVTAYDGTNYLITWADHFFSSGSVVKGRFFNTSGVPIGTEFTLFSRLGSKVPFFGYPVFENNEFLIVSPRVDTINLSNGDIYGKFIQSSTSGIIEYKIPNTLLNLYPNPTSDIVTLNISNTNNAVLTLNIYTIIGELVRSELLKQNQQEINLNNLSTGIYIVEIKSGEWTAKQKIIIQK